MELRGADQARGATERAIRGADGVIGGTMDAFNSKQCQDRAIGSHQEPYSPQKSYMHTNILSEAKNHINMHFTTNRAIGAVNTQVVPYDSQGNTAGVTTNQSLNYSF